MCTYLTFVAFLPQYWVYWVTENVANLGRESGAKAAHAAIRSQRGVAARDAFAQLGLLLVRRFKLRAEPCCESPVGAAALDIAAAEWEQGGFVRLTREAGWAQCRMSACPKPTCLLTLTLAALGPDLSGECVVSTGDGDGGEAMLQAGGVFPFRVACYDTLECEA